MIFRRISIASKLYTEARITTFRLGSSFKMLLILNKLPKHCKNQGLMEYDEYST